MENYSQEQTRDFSHLHVSFFSDTAKDEEASRKEGRPIFRDVHKVRIQSAGDPKNIFVGYADEKSPQRGPDGMCLTYAELHKPVYDAFREGVEYVGSGTPLESAPFITPAKAQELKALKIHTLEALAGLDGPNLNRLGMGGRNLKDLAEGWISKAANTAEYSKLSQENADMAAKMAALEAKVLALSGGAESGEPDKTQTTEVSPDNPFAGWKREDVVAWMTDMGAEVPHHKCSDATVLEKAKEWNNELAKRKAEKDS